MIIDTSALLAVMREEDGCGPLLNALVTEAGLLPAPVLVEFWRVTMGRGSALAAFAQPLLDMAYAAGARIVPLDETMAEAAIAAIPLHGTGNGRGGRLNMLDLMVYSVAKATDRPILCTGNDFASTDAAIHPASRVDAQSSSSS